MADRRVTFLIGANIKNFQKNLNKAQRRFKRFGRTLENTGKAMSQAVTVPLLTASGMAVKFAADFEQAMVEVQKVTDETTAAELTDSIREMAETIPLAQTELAGLAADAARFGVRGTANIEAFTETAAKMAEATDLAAQDAGRALAKIANQTNLPTEKIGNLGSAINELSNNFATSSSEIVDSMMRSSAAASQFGLSAQEITGLSAQMNAMSESAERAGTRMRRLLQDLSDPKKAAGFANALGMTTAEFRRMRDNNPRELLMQMVRSMAESGEQARMLKGQLTSTSRQAVTALAQNVGDLNKAMDMSSTSFSENTSLQEEFEDAMGTFTNQVKLLWNQIKDLGITIGNILIPPLRNLISNYVKPAVEGFRNMSSAGQRMIVVAAGLAAAIGPVVFVIGKLFTVIAAISSPITLVLGSLAALAGAATYVANNWEAFTDRFPRWWAIIKNATLSVAADIVGGIVHMASVIRNIMAAPIDYIKSNWQAFGDFFNRMWIKVKNGVIDVVADIVEWLKNLYSYIPGMSDTIEAVADNIRGYKEEVPDKSDAKGFQSFSEFVKQQNKKTEDAVKAAKDSINGMKSEVPTAKDAKSFQSFSDFIGGAASGIMSWFEGITNAALGAKEATKQAAKEAKKATQRTQPKRSQAGSEGGVSESDRVGSVPGTATDIALNKDMIDEARRFMNRYGMAIDATTQIANRFVNSFGQGLQNLIVQGKNLGDVLSNIGKLLASSAIQTGIKLLLTGGVSGGVQAGKGVLGKLLGGFFADGGRPPVGQASVVGEKGPELWVPDRPGTIVPNGTGVAMTAANSATKSTIRIENVINLDSKTVDRQLNELEFQRDR